MKIAFLGFLWVVGLLLITSLFSKEVFVIYMFTTTFLVLWNWEGE